MQRDMIRDALASHADEYELRRRLHDVPPYEVYEVVVDDRRAVCKVDAHPRGHAATEGRVQAYAARETPAPVPDVLAVGPDHYLAAWSDEVPSQGAPDLDAAKARTMGAGMARFHEATAFDAYGLPRADADEAGVADCGGLPVETFADWPAAATVLVADSRDYVATQGYGDVVDAVHEFLRDHPEVFDGVGDPVLCHGNWLPEHVGVERGGAASGPVGRATAVIDFEHALVAPPAYDVLRSLGPLSGDEGHAEAFREGYETVRNLGPGFDRRVAAFQVVNVVRYLEALYLQGNVGAAEADERADRMRAFAFERLDDLSAAVDG